MTRIIRQGLIAGVILLVSGLSNESARAVQATRPPMTLAVPGATNSTPAIAAFGRSVAVVWTATAKNGPTNVYIATSADGGATFSAPRRVNNQEGDASANNEQPPRVTISGSADARTVTVIWSKRGDGDMRTRRDAVRLARSSDGGQTFSPARAIHDSTFSGARGWESLATDPDG